MEVLELLSSSNLNRPNGEVAYGIVPTVLLPLAFLSTGISVVATFIAGLFGLKLKAEGPKKLLELLLKPKLLISAVFLNGLIYLGFMGINHIKNGPVPSIVQDLYNSDIKFNKKSIRDNQDFKWSQNLGEGVFAKGVVVNKELFVGTAKGHLFVLDIDTGNIKNKIFFGKFLSPTPIYNKGYLYFGEGLHESHNMGVYKFNVANKKVEKKYKTKGHTEVSPLIALVENREILYQAAGGDGIHAIDPVSMKKIWHFKDGHMDGSPLVVGNNLYIGSGVPKEEQGIKRPMAYKINAKTGQLIWKKELSLSNWYSPFVVNNQVCFTQGEIHIKSKLGGISCFFKDGKRGAKITVDYPIISTPLVEENKVIFNDFYGGVYLWSIKDNSLLWSNENRTKRASYSSIKSLNNLNYLFIDGERSIRLINKRNGEIIKKIVTDAKGALFADPLFFEDGFVVFGMKGDIKYYRKSKIKHL
jgi:outer membrane protein assembly factor BamB